MDEKISLEAIASYADSYAEKVQKRFFSGKDQITGKEILDLCNVKQINLFVLKELFSAWRAETRKARSIYFDNDHPEVREALSAYMAVVSNHILVDKQNFLPLLRKAVSSTLLVIFNPYDFYSTLITGNNNRLELGAFRDEIRYLRINKRPLEKMVEALEQKSVRELPGNEAFAILDHILEEVNFTPEDVDGYIRQFSEVLPLDPEKFYIEERQAKDQKVQKAPAARKSKSEMETDPSLNEKLISSREPAVMDNLRRISKIRDNLSINQKFMFTKVLFYGDFDTFSRAIDDLDQLPDMESAVRYLEKHSSQWDRDSNEFHEFMELIEKRFN